MNRAELEKDMKATIGAFPTVTAFAAYMGWSRDKARAFLADIPVIPGTRAQRFYKDITQKICER